MANNQLRTLTLPPTLPHLWLLALENNPLEMLILPYEFAEETFPWLVETLRLQGVDVIAYPIVPRLMISPSFGAGLLTLTLAGPPGAYRVAGSPDLDFWIDLGAVASDTGRLDFEIAPSPESPSAFYRLTWTLNRAGAPCDRNDAEPRCVRVDHRFQNRWHVFRRRPGRTAGLSTGDRPR